MQTNATISELNQALDLVNKRYNNNIIFRWPGPEQISRNRTKFTLTVKDSRGPGSRVSASVYQNRRRVKAACWHVHGHFFDGLFSINPDLFVRSAGRKITREAGNWYDWNIGSQMYPVYFSEACDC